MGASIHSTMVLAQSGAVTINEIRRMAGLSPIPDYDIMPATAGAPERGGAGSKENREKTGGNGQRGRGAHPGGGSSSTDSRNASAGEYLKIYGDMPAKSLIEPSDEWLGRLRDRADGMKPGPQAEYLRRLMGRDSVIPDLARREKAKSFIDKVKTGGSGSDAAKKFVADQLK